MKEEQKEDMKLRQRGDVCIFGASQSMNDCVSNCMTHTIIMIMSIMDDYRKRKQDRDSMIHSHRNINTMCYMIIVFMIMIIMMIVVLRYVLLLTNTNFIFFLFLKERKQMTNPYF